MINEINNEVYKTDWRWQEGEFQVTRSAVWSGPGCHNGCGVLYYTKDGKLDHVEGDPQFPYNQGRLCLRCLDMPEAVNHPDRIKYPMLRDGEKGENKWKRISWDEAYDWIEEKYNEICETIRQYPGGIGPEGIVGLAGTGRNTMWHIAMNIRAAFGSPNVACSFLSGESCYQPRMLANMLQEGDAWILDAAQTLHDRYQNPEWTKPEVIVVWGNEPLASNGDGFMGHWLIDLMRMGSKFIVIDPALTWLASKAEILLQPRPGTDCALALGMLNVIINEDLYDHEFVENWVYGFEELTDFVQEWTPAKAAEVTWVPEKKIIAAARMYAAGNPSAMQWGLAIDQQVSGMEASMAITDLVALTGNLDVPGGNIIVRYAYNSSKKYGAGMEFVSKEMLDRRIGLSESPLCSSGYTVFIPCDRLIEQLESGEPYPVQMFWVEGSNGIANMAAAAPRVYAAWKKVPYTVVVDMFMTPTAIAFADLVLPAAMSCERNSFRSWWQPLRSITKSADTYFEAKSDEEIVLDMGKRFRPDFFGQFEDMEAFLTWMIQEEGNGVDYTYKELNERVYDYWDFNETYRKYEKGLLRRDGKPGFVTATGLFEAYSPVFDVLDLHPLPVYCEPYESPVRTPEVYKDYPYLLTTGHRQAGLFHSEHRQLDYMRQFYPQPIADISQKIADEQGIQEGDWIWIEGPRGKCKQIAHIAPGLLPELVRARHGWWFPEKEAEEPSLFGVFDSNSNNLTTLGVTGHSGFGAPYKSLLCKVYKVTEENDCSPSTIVTREGGFGGNDKLKFFGE